MKGTKHISRILKRGALTTGLFMSCGFGHGCSGQDELGSAADLQGAQPEDVDSHSDPLYISSGNLWPGRIIRVCFEPGFPSPERTWARHVLKGQRSWEDAARVNFVGFGTCAQGEAGIRIQPDEVNYASSLGPRDAVVRVHLKVGDDISCLFDPPVSDEQCFKQVVLHEFGHALAFAHERTRSDTPTACPAPSGETPGDLPWGPWDAQSIMITWGGGGACLPSEDLSSYDRRGANRVYGTREGDTPRLGDFNGDGRSDLLCHNATGDGKQAYLADSNGQFSGINWSITLNWCAHDTAKLFKGDFNGDGRTDLLCHDVSHGKKWIDYATSAGVFNGTDWSRSATGCNGIHDELHIGDVNGDGKDDLICHDRLDGDTWIDYADSNGRFSTPDSTVSSAWCAQPTRRLFTGDFNGDGRTDRLCHDMVSGSKWIDLASSSGEYGTTDLPATPSWCSQPSGQVYVGDFNADGRDDLLCQDTRTGTKQIDYADTVGQLSGTDWSTTTAWCGAGIERLYVGDFNNDNRDDLLCHNIRSGTKEIDYADSNGRFGGPNWDNSNANWCGFDQFLLR